MPAVITDASGEKDGNKGWKHPEPGIMKGQLHIYTGNGKGKTTAALGLLVRAYGAGKRILFAQFVKGMEYHEIKTLKLLSDRVDYRIFGRECFIHKEPDEADIRKAQKHFAELRTMLQSNCPYDVVILDELNIAAYFKLIPVEEILNMVDQCDPHVELVITGRYAPQELIERADLVTEMQEIRHYYTEKDLQAREGIEY